MIKETIIVMIVIKTMKIVNNSKTRDIDKKQTKNKQINY